ncbi:TPA: hypothetical protein L9425_003748 [Klebsiella pneumoniae]|nr:hypothetical protein [Klebsiella pneumoniae]HBR7915922.1 hypothetical protein [Klebsiella pneumoniae]
MDINEFSIICKRALDVYFKKIEREVANGELEYGGEKIERIYYPTTLLCVESDDKALSFELLGLTPVRVNLKIKKRTNISLEQLTQIDKGENGGVPLIVINDRNIISELSFSDKEAGDLLKIQGHVIADDYSSGIICNQNSYLIGFNDDSKSCMVSECVMAYVNNNILRVRYIYKLFLFSVCLTEKELLDKLDYFIGQEVVFGAQVFPHEKYLCWVKASHLINLVLNDQIHETTIGDYINDHPDILLDALGYKGFVYEPNLEWIEKTDDNPDLYINPDALLEREDGCYDICDFKKGLVKKKSVTKGERRRRRFIDGVGEGLAQLDNYEEYFTYPLNAKHALEKYGVRVNSPKKILIVGNHENTNSVEVAQALRGRTDTVVIDYDSLISSYVGKLKNSSIEPEQ